MTNTKLHETAKCLHCGGMLHNPKDEWVRLSDVIELVTKHATLPWNEHMFRQHGFEIHVCPEAALVEFEKPKCAFDPRSGWCPIHGTIEHCPEGYRLGYVYEKFGILPDELSRSASAGSGTEGMVGVLGSSAGRNPPRENAGRNKDSTAQPASRKPKRRPRRPVTESPTEYRNHDD